MDLYKKIQNSPFFIAGPCVIESEELVDNVAKKLVDIRQKLGVTVIFKASFDKANRTSLGAERGPGLKRGLEIIKVIKDKYDLPVTTDIHIPSQAEIAAEVIDILQIPAFLCRQTDLLVEAAKTGRIVNVKKAQFLSGKDMQYPLEKVIGSGNDKVLLTERGNMMGYNNLVVDFRNIIDMKSFGVPVVMDCTHAVQRPGGAGGKTGGNREFVPYMAMAAKAFGANGYFIETHPNPDQAWSDGPNMLQIDELEGLISKLND